jgi:hypothetical protein
MNVEMRSYWSSYLLGWKFGRVAKILDGLDGLSSRQRKCATSHCGHKLAVPDNLNAPCNGLASVRLCCAAEAGLVLFLS